MLDFKLLEALVDEALSNETAETLTEWLNSEGVKEELFPHIDGVCLTQILDSFSQDTILQKKNSVNSNCNSYTDSNPYSAAA